MTIREEFEKAYKAEFGKLATIPCYEALWAARWILENLAKRSENAKPLMFGDKKVTFITTEEIRLIAKKLEQ